MHPAALTAEQVAALYASGSANGAPLPPEQADPGPPPPPPPPSAYPTTVLADTPSMYWHLGELGQSPMADASGSNRVGTYRNGNTYGQEDALVNGSDTAVLMPGRPASATATSPQAAPPPTRSRRGSRPSSFNGGKILGYEDAQTGWGVNYDRQVYMTNNGRIAYGIKSGGVNQIDHVDHALQQQRVAPRRRHAGCERHGPVRRRCPDRHQRHRDAGCLQPASGGSVAETSPAG